MSYLPTVIAVEGSDTALASTLYATLYAGADSALSAPAL